MKWEPGRQRGKKGEDLGPDPNFFTCGPFTLCKALCPSGPVYTLTHKNTLVASLPEQEGKLELIAMAKNYRSSE